MLCLGIKRNGQPCTLRGRYNGYCGHHRGISLAINRTIVRRQQIPIRICVNQYCNMRSRNYPFITCQNHDYMEIMNRCYFQYENGHRCDSSTSISLTYCRNHQLILDETIRNMTWGHPSLLPQPRRPSTGRRRTNSNFISLNHQIPPQTNNIIESIKQKIKKVVLLVETKMFNHDCPICFEHFKLNEEVYELKCKHHYHPKCLDEWIKQKGKKSSCPLDRKKIE